MDEITFARNSSMLGRSEKDVLIMCTDAGFSASMIVFYIGKEYKGGVEIRNFTQLRQKILR